MSNKTQEQKLNALIQATCNANDEADKAFHALVVGMQESKETDVEKAATAIMMNLVEAGRLQDSIRTTYEYTLTMLEKEQIAWNKITEYLQLVAFAGVYPLKEDGKPQPLAKTRSTTEAGRYINKFNSYRSQYSDYGIPKTLTPRVAPIGGKGNKEVLEVDTHTVERVEAKETLQAVAKDESQTSKPTIFRKADIPNALEFMYLLLEKSEDADLIGAVETLAIHFEVKL